MRSIKLLNAQIPVFLLSKDPQHLIAQFFSAALNDPEHLHDEIAEIFTPESDGYYLIDQFSACRIEFEEEIPPKLYEEWLSIKANFADIWVLYKEEKGNHVKTCLLSGDEFRHLFAIACLLVLESDNTLAD